MEKWPLLSKLNQHYWKEKGILKGLTTRLGGLFRIAPFYINLVFVITRSYLVITRNNEISNVL